MHRRSRPKSARPLSVASLLLGLLVACPLSASAGVDHHPSAGEPPLLARWNEGGLSAARFVERYDPEQRALGAGGRVLREAVCKAVFREIYGNLARDLGLDRSPEFLAEYEASAGRLLANLYREIHGPALESIDENRVRELYQARAGSDLSSAGRADLEVLFVRLSGGGADDADRERFERTRLQIEQGALSWQSAVERERERSGPANGSFTGIGLSRLAAELRDAVELAEIGGPAQMVETEVGLYLLRVTRRSPPSTLPFEEVAATLRTELWRMDTAAWERETTADLGRLWGRSSSTSSDELFAIAARRAGLDRDDRFLARLREWQSRRLADLGFFADDRFVPPPDEILDRVRRDPTLRSRHLRYSVAFVSFDAVSDHAGAIRGAENLTALLAKGPVDLQALPPDPLRTTIHVADLHGSDLDRVERGLASSVAGGQIGAHHGPFPVVRAREALLVDPQGGFRRRLELPPGIVVAILEGIDLPATDQLVEEVRRGIRAAAGSCDAVERRLGPAWGLELLVE